MNTEYFDSSLKHFNFKGWTADQILEKYESVLALREKQITDLSIEMGSINDKLNILTEQVEQYKKENEQLKSTLKKKETLLAQELNNKEIMFIRLEKRENEYDELKMKYDILVRDKGEPKIPSMNNPYIPPSSSSYTPITTPVQQKEITQSNIVEQSKDIKDKDSTTKTTEEDWKEKAKISARSKLNEVKSKQRNLTKINFSELLQKKEEKAKEEQKKEEPKTEEGKKEEMKTEEKVETKVETPSKLEEEAK